MTLRTSLSALKPRALLEQSALGSFRGALAKLFSAPDSVLLPPWHWVFLLVSSSTDDRGRKGKSADSIKHQCVTFWWLLGRIRVNKLNLLGHHELGGLLTVSHMLNFFFPSSPVYSVSRKMSWKILLGPQKNAKWEAGLQRLNLGGGGGEDKMTNSLDVHCKQGKGKCPTEKCFPWLFTEWLPSAGLSALSWGQKQIGQLKTTRGAYCLE